MQQGDVKLFQTDDNGEIEIERGIVIMSGGLETAAYLSLFGGSDWWGNLQENQPARKYNSETEKLLESIPAVSVNLRRIEEAAKRDLQWFLDTGVASSVTVNASIPGVNKVKLEMQIDQDQISFIENWKASA